jgi:predicted DNA-binding ribbon-helix-helix protein
VSTPLKHSVALGAANGVGEHQWPDTRLRTSVSLESVFLDGLRDIAAEREISVTALISEVSAGCEGQRLSLALREYVCLWYAARVWVLKGLPASKENGASHERAR